ncbi:hypothetical protein EHS24_006724 [Apiotrichum porosum]|uniref:DNA 3'-5' helicase n=1 Tax=Apiotrichum porosum TaxID=105984 RepID=A0A427XCG3_9TREE|nr:hypothetical protein EHS24_006724 [Apiotrichum porosum]
MAGDPHDMPFFDEDDAPRFDSARAPAPQSGPSGIAARAMAARQGHNNPPDYLKGLNPEQRQAVETTEGPVLVLAGAGTGKTRVLTTRIAHILSQGLAFPSQILAVTFTNKAAREMKQRVGILVGEAVEGMPWLGTFHSIGVKLLRRHAELAGLRSDFTILDTDDVIPLGAAPFAQMIDGWKNKGLGPDEIPEGDARAFANGRPADHAERLRLRRPVAAPDPHLRQHHDVLAEYHRKFKYILVDEYQDTNTAQYMWLRLLAQRPKQPSSPRSRGEDAGRQMRGGANVSEASSRPSPGPADHPLPVNGERERNLVNICCVGDDDQSIYGWRGAEVDNILRFEKDFPGATVIRLERNYRSTAHILGAAAHLIAHNEGRLGKTLFTDRPDPEDPKVNVHAAWDSDEEARAVGETIEAYQRDRHKLNDMAILVRASFQMRSFEDRFIEIGLNYRVIGGPRFYERQEIRDAMAFFRVVAQGADDLAFERIVNVPKRGLGDATIRQIHDTARALRRRTEAEAARRLREVAANFARWQSLLDTTPHTELAETILEESGYTDMWKNDRSADAPGRLENLKELIRSMEESESLRAFLEHVALVMDAEQNEGLDAVSIMTLHSAKGLEFETVFLPGWEEGLGTAAAYVGLTRAKKNLHLWFVSNRRIHGLWQSTIPSRFLDELPEAHVEVQEGGGSNYGGYVNPYGGAGRQNPYGASRFDSLGSPSGGFAGRGDQKGGAAGQERGQGGAFSNSYATPGWARAQQNRTEATSRNWGTRSGHQVERIGYGEVDSGYGAGRTSVKGRTIEGELVAKSVADQPSAFKVGDRVFHQKFGNGNISAIDGNKLTIDFDRAGQKKVLDGFVTAV